MEARRHLHGVYHRGRGLRPDLYRRGRLQDKFGPFWISLTGAVLVSLGFFLCAFTHSLTYLFVCFGVIGGLGNGFGYSTPIPVMAKWFPDKRGLAVGLAVGGYGAGSALFGPLANLIAHSCLRRAHHVQDPGRNFPGHDRDWCVSAEEPSRRATSRKDGRPLQRQQRRARPPRNLPRARCCERPTFYFMWIAYALGTSAGLMVISQLVPFAKSVHIPSAALATMGLVVGAAGNASGRILSGWMSDALGRLNVLRLMIAISMISMPLLYLAGGNVSLPVRDGVHRVLVLRHAVVGERLRHRRLLGHQECRHELRHAVYRVGRGRNYRCPESVACCSTSTRTIRWRSTPRRFWPRWR